ncbi:hypothetical protein Csa_007380 [Cucumis sativus]|nr:hypothetical protein Csa_007380 [Cucumis sativus]
MSLTFTFQLSFTVSKASPKLQALHSILQFHSKPSLCSSLHLMAPKPVTIQLIKSSFPTGVSMIASMASLLPLPLLSSTLVVGGPPAIERVWISYISESPILDLDCDWNNE